MAACVPRLREESGNLTAFGFENVTELAPGPFPLEEIVRNLNILLLLYPCVCSVELISDKAASPLEELVRAL